MSDILSKLSFQDILFFSGSLHALIHLDDSFSNFSQLIPREACQIFYLQAFIVICLIGKYTEFGNITTQTTGETIEHKRKNDDGNKSKPDIMLISLKRLCQIIVIWQRRTYNQLTFRKIGCHIEIIVLEGRRLTFHTGSHSILKCLRNLRSFCMIGKLAKILTHIIIDNLTIRLDKSHSQVFTFVFLNKILKFSLSYPDTIHQIHRIRQQNTI